MAERLRASSGRSAAFWLAGSSATLGGSIWAMHFMGLLALRMPQAIGYEPIATGLSLAIAIAFVAAGLQIARAGSLSRGRLALSGTVVGVGVAAMHYVGMAALLFPGTVAYRPGLWTLSVLIAVAAATVALWLALTLDAVWQRAAAAIVMATAISGMHYTGMASTAFLVDLRVTTGSGLSAGPLAAAVGGIALTLSLLAIVLVAADRRLFAAARHEHEVLRLANAELEATRKQIVRRLCLAGEFRDSDTGDHVERIGLMAHRLALALGCEPGFADDLLIAAPLHDIGKIGISDSILLKPGMLSKEERTEIERHPGIGDKILKGSGVRLLDLAAEIAHHHHEKWNGTGYPSGLEGEAISLASRIVAVVDVFDALMSPRPYKQAWPLDRIVAHLRAEAGRHFDPAIVRVFLENLPAMIAIREQHCPPGYPSERPAYRAAS